MILLRFIRFLLIGIMLLSLLPQWVVAQTPDARVKFFVLPREEERPFTIGDQITLRLEVIHPTDSQGVSFPPLGEQWGDFDVIAQNNIAPVNHEDNTTTTSQDVVVALYKPGDYVTEALVVTHIQADGSTEELGAPVIELTIKSVLIEGDTTLRDLRPQASLEVPPIWPWVLAGLALTFLLTGLIVGTGLWLYHRRKQHSSIFEAPELIPDLRPPEVIAYAELDRIEALNLPAKHQYKMHYSLVTDCLRHYIEDRYKMPALERTTTELRFSFGKSLLSTEVVRSFIELFMESDLVKFARLRPAQHDASRLIPVARAIVENTTPQPEPHNNALETELEPEVTA